MRTPRFLLALSLFLGFNAASARACEFNVSVWPHLAATVHHSFGWYTCKYDRNDGYWWEYRCTLSEKAEGANPIRESATLSVNPEGHPSYESEFIAHGFGGEDCHYNAELVK